MTIAKHRLTLFAATAMVVCSWSELRAQVLSPDAVTGESAVQDTAEPVASESDGFWSGVKMPKLSMPKMSMPKIPMPSWPKNEDGIAMSPFTPISSGMSKISSGTKKAWQGTKEIFTFGGDDKSKAAAARAAKPRVSVWDRLRGKPEQPTGPQTVAEWMSQPRVNH